MPARADGDFSTYSDLKGPHFGARYPKKWEYPEISTEGQLASPSLLVMVFSVKQRDNEGGMGPGKDEFAWF